MSACDCSTRSFRALLLAQFFGALNDNLYKFSLSFLLIHYYGAKGAEDSGYLYLLTIVFTLPFLIFAPYSGYLADRYSKSAIIKAVKVFELIIMAAGCYFIMQVNVAASYILLFLMGLHSTIFSPAKYGVIPEILDTPYLSKGNGYIQLLTFLAIILGSALAGVLMAGGAGTRLLPALTVLGVSCAGLLSSTFIGKTKAANPERKFEPNPFREFFRILKEIKGRRALYLCVQAVNYFWMLGALLQPTILLYAKSALSLDETGSGILLAVCGLGIGCGSILAGRVSEGKVELGLVPLGTFGLAATSAGLFFVAGNYTLALILLFTLGVSAGLYIVPLNAFFQKESPLELRGSYLATSSFLNSLAMIVGSVILFVVDWLLHPTPAQLFLGFALTTLLTGIYIVTVVPQMLVRCINWILAHTLYSIRIVGKENVPEQGGALIVCNHVSYIDAQLLAASLDRPVRFLMYRPFFEARFVHPVAKAAGAIPISKTDGKEGVAKALSEAREAVMRGELVGIFAEGTVSRTGHLLPFRSGFESIMQGLEAPIIPAYIDRLWGSIFSFRGGKFFWKRPKKAPYPVTVSFGSALPSETKASALRLSIQNLGVNAFSHREKLRMQLPYSFLEQLRSSPFRVVVADGVERGQSYLSIFSDVIAMCAALRTHVAAGEIVGVSDLLAKRALVINLALSFLGAVPFNLPPSDRETVNDLILRAGVKKVLVTDGVELSSSVESIKIDALSARFSTMHRLFYELAALLLPGRYLFKLFACRSRNADLPAIVVATRGRSRAPALIPLSHANVCANVESLADILQFSGSDAILGVVPLSHGYGAVTNMWLPLLAGVKITFPQNNAELGTTIKKHKINTIFEQSAKLKDYLKLDPKECATLERIICGGDPLDEKLVAEIEEKFKVEVLEGYGSVELTAVALLNVPGYFQGRHSQQGAKSGSVGHPIPGVVVRVVDPNSFIAKPAGEIGVLAFKGASVVGAHLEGKNQTQSKLQDGWYISNDQGRIDADGFVEVL